ncbi:FAR11 [Candida theae]|uniref:FAR11 n=1 Tax=Candida theae TaxID=1198502 RepID=A0AAD5G0H9_9ASCO|nr:FAR11 [Candida theae]KAI5965114.1 FAR11 [Candida theae]
MNDELIQIDQLEDQIIDHPDERTRKELHDTSLDETFQKKLSAKAKEFESSSPMNDEFGEADDSISHDTSMGYQFLITKSHLNYHHQEYGDMQQEISEWFTFHDLKFIGGLDILLDSFESNHDMEELTTRLLGSSIGGDLSCLKNVLYFSFGEYASKSTVEEQVRQIIANNLKLLELEVYKPLITMLLDFMKTRIDKDTSEITNCTISKRVEVNYFRVLTLLYILVLTALHNPQESKQFRKFLSLCSLLESVVQFIEHWKWHHNNSYRVRYLVLLLNKLLLLEFGDKDQLASCDAFLNQLHHIKTFDNSNTGKPVLKCSPLDYFAFRQDLLDKYPLYELGGVKDLQDTWLNKSTDSSIEERYKTFMAVNAYSNSLSNSIEIPKTNKSHTVLGQLPAQPVHIATPLPSPKLMSSDFMSGGEKIRKSYQVNQSMPFIYPNEYQDDCSSNVPYAMLEADEILKNSVYESYSVKRLWSEREKFMKQERGYVDAYDDKDEFDYSFGELRLERPENIAEIDSLERVERFYSETFFRLHSIIEVFMEIIKANRIDRNLSLYEFELNPATSFMVKSTTPHENDEAIIKVEQLLLSQLEVMNVKEIMTKTAVGIILRLLQWFKKSHVLKYYYLSSLLFDQQFFNISLDFISNGFNNPNNQSLSHQTGEKRDDLLEYEMMVNQNKLMNPQIKIPKLEFFHNCLRMDPKSSDYTFINKSFISELPKQYDSKKLSHVYISNFNHNFASILADMLEINNKILIKNQSHRIFSMNDIKPSELFKMILINYDNEAFSHSILKILKKLVPYQGRKWKSMNMDLISTIYLNCKLSMKDNWLSGKDLGSEFHNSYDQEVALRALLQFYNIKRYSGDKLGYKLNRSDNLADIPLLNLNDLELE